MTPRQATGCFAVIALSVVVALVSFVAGLVCLSFEAPFNCLLPLLVLPAVLLLFAYATYTFVRSIVRPEDDW